MGAVAFARDQRCQGQINLTHPNGYTVGRCMHCNQVSSPLLDSCQSEESSLYQLDRANSLYRLDPLAFDGLYPRKGIIE